MKWLQLSNLLLYFLNRPIQRSKSCFIALILLFGGCQDEQPSQVKLDSVLKTHFSLIQNKQLGAARVRLRQHMDNHAESSDALFLMGLSYHQDKQYSKAVDWFKKGVSTELDDIYPPTWHFLGWSYFNLGQIQKSKDAFTQHLMLHPDEEDSLFGLGLIAIEEGNLIEAKQMFLQSMQQSKLESVTQAKATARCGDVSAELGNWQDAISLYEKAVTLNPDLYEAWYRLARALHRIGQVEASSNAMQQFALARHRIRPELDSQTRFPE